jgi:hypothetical protein
LESFGDWLNFDVSKLTHRPRDPFKRKWPLEHGMLTTPIEVEPPTDTSKR